MVVCNITKGDYYISVDSKGIPAHCKHHEPFCYTGYSGPEKERCEGQICISDDFWNEGGSVAYCCHYNNSEELLPASAGRRCCSYDESCRDNYSQEDECNYW